MAADKFIELGRIVGVYGVKGWLKVKSVTDPANNIMNYKPWWLLIDQQWQQQTVEAVQAHGIGFIAKLEGLNDRTAAEQYKGMTIGMPRERLPELSEDQHYWHDLEGMAVTNADGSALGTVDYLIATGANDVLVVKEGKKEVLIPFLRETVIKRVDYDENMIHVDWFIEEALDK